jgi:hypothetical protein
MGFSRAEWVRAVACGLLGAAASLGGAVYHTESVPPLPRFLIFCVGAVAAAPGALVAGTLFGTPFSDFSVAAAIAISGLFWMWACLRVTRRRNARRTGEGRQ